MQNQKIPLLATLLAVPFLITACLSSDDSSSTSSEGETGQLSLAITDAPVDRATKAVIEFDRVLLKRRGDGSPFEIEFDDVREIDLLSLQGSDHEWLLEDEVLPAGRYEWVRLGVLPYDGAKVPGSKLTSSYLEFPADPDLPPSPKYLEIPSGLQTGLKLQGEFTVPVNEAASFTIDFDLRRSIVTVPRGGNFQDPDFMLKPVVRVLDNAEVGHLEGSLDFDGITDLDACPETGGVYVFEGADAEPSDMRTDSGPLTTASLEEDGTEISYRVGFLQAGEYTLALTCDSDLDHPEDDNSEDVAFPVQANGVVEAGQTNIVDLP